MRNFVGYFLLSSLLLLGPDLEYQPLKHQEWAACYASSFEIGHPEKYSVDYVFCNLDDGFEYAFLNEHIVKASDRVVDFISNQGLTAKDCKPREKIEIFETDVETLNDKEKFSGWEQQNGPKTQRIWALYDPRASELNVSTIVLTKQTEDWNELLIAHEVAHYWFDRFCLEKQWKGGTEDFALKFESFYYKE